jgi:hypothetical protein
MLSKKFISLLESMKSPHNEMYEDRDERVERREERRRERREDKFGVSTSSTDGTTTEVEGDTDFKIRPFIRAVDQLKSQVQSEIFNIDQTIKNRESGSQSASTYKTKFNAILEIILKIVSKVDLIKDKEGRNLEANDLAEIKIFRGLYTTASNDFLAAQKEWSEKKLEADTKYLSDLKDTDTNNFIIGANKAFDEAKAMLNDLIRNSQSAGSSGSSGSSGTSGSTDIATGDTIKGGKYAKDSKEGKIVIAVKKTIYTKFKKYKSLSDTNDWKVVYKAGVDNVSGTLLANTQAVIKLVKLGLATKEAPELKSDKTGDITPAFIAAINKISEGKENTSGRLITFENFIKNKINEQFDEEAVKTSIASGSSSSSSSNNSGSNTKPKTEKPKVPTQEYNSTGFDNETDGNEFRAWVIKTHKEWAETNDLWAQGPKDNRLIRKAFSQFGADYAKTKEAPAEVKTVAKLTLSQLQQIVTSIKASGAKAEIKVTTEEGNPYVFWWRGKEYGHIFTNFRLTFVSSSGKKFNGTYATGGNIKFDNGKTITLKDFVLGNASFKISGEKPEVAQSKKAFVASSGDGYVNVRSGAFADTKGGNANLIYKHTDKSKQIGVVVSSQVTKSSKIGDKTWYKVQFPTKMSGQEFGYVRSDTVDLK